MLQKGKKEVENKNIKWTLRATVITSNHLTIVLI